MILDNFKNLIKEMNLNWLQNQSELLNVGSKTIYQSMGLIGVISPDFFVLTVYRINDRERKIEKIFARGHEKYLDDSNNTIAPKITAF